ncbi:TRAP transporter large permease subunit [Pikeienuella piscinae]|uniref:TRAP transporter large permease subunit n=1 Tax=Pikeienuella piscinae TaxID=2748098 RepID=A0A7L5BXJ9_9RHOB|nr:TRAP transporter large permease subunit [Pikeienuella piscinae]QIE55247.1 TRAP transporter large permease subunit [Pikeienuella piscinae]
MSDTAQSAGRAAAPRPARGGAFAICDALLEAISVALLLGAAAVAILQVFCRYVLNASLPWPEELAQWFFGWAVFLGMALLTGRNSHIAIGFLGPRLPPAARAAQRFLIRAVVTAASLALILHGIDFMGRAMQVSPALEWPISYLVLAVPVGAALNILFLFRAGPPVATLAAALAGGALYFAVRAGAPLLLSPQDGAAALMIVGLTLIFLEVPIAFALTFGAFAGLAPMGDMMLMTVAQNISASLNSFTLLAIPFFIMAAAVMNAGGVTGRLLELATHLVGHFRGGLGQANVVTNVMLAGVSGSSTADASAIAKLLAPEMEQRGYSRAFACALTSASSTLANLIPPGLGLIIYAALASVSVGALFVATIVPGLLAATALAFVVYAVSRRRGYGAGVARSSGEERLTAFWYAIPALLLPVFIVGGVRFGVFTATEAGAMALAFAILCGALVYRGLTARSFVHAAREAASDTVAVAIIIAAAAPFAWILTFEQAPQKIAAALSAISGDEITLLLLINAFLLFVGLFMEMIAAMVILVPILVPVVAAAGVDPIQFGVVLVLNLVIGALTPPLGVLVFTTARVGGADAVAVFREIIPFVIALIVVLLLVTFAPALTLWPVAWFGP